MHGQGECNKKRRAEESATRNAAAGNKSRGTLAGTASSLDSLDFLPSASALAFAAAFCSSMLGGWKTRPTPPGATE